MKTKMTAVAMVAVMIVAAFAVVGMADNGVADNTSNGQKNIIGTEKTPMLSKQATAMLLQQKQITTMMPSLQKLTGLLISYGV